jgi:H+/Cl- antiporter ClcA
MQHITSQRRLVVLTSLAVGLGGLAAVMSQILIALINGVTHLAYFGTFDTGPASPAHHHLGMWAMILPVIGGLIVGAMARYGSPAIRGHGIPEAMEQVLLNESRIPPRMIWLKPVSAAVAIGTGGPFGAEGPIIATGGALGSWVGQLLHTTADERKILLCSGAAAGMAATFGTPVAAVALAIELLLFEFRPRSTMVVAMATVTATGVRYAMLGSAPAFNVATFAPVTATALAIYTLMGLVMGLLAVAVVWAVYAVEDAFDHLPLHWMWWPAIGGVAVGVMGLIEPRTLGVGYDNIENIVGGGIVGKALLLLVVAKLASWLIALGSGTSGGTLAPLLTIGAGAGVLIGSLIPGCDPRMAAIVGMAAMFAGASRAMLTSVIFACEATGQLSALLPLLGCCSLAYAVAQALQPNSIMTEKLVRRGTYVPSDYVALKPSEQSPL